MSPGAGEIDYQALLKEGYLQIRAMRERLDGLERARCEPIAVTGIGCRFPGGGNGPAGFWQMLRAGADATREVPPERWDVDAWYDPDPDAPGKMYVRRGAFLDDVDRFDAGFFNISARECSSMDPQQRLLLEVAWEAIEDAAIPRDRLAGSATGVYVGAMFHDYAHLIAASGLQHVDTYFGTGNGIAFLAGRLSHHLGLQGPSLVLDTACSSSLVAVHLACQSLRLGEIDLALACGVNLMLSPLSSVVMCRLRALAPDGRCKTFDEHADGYARGEGCGVVVLKRLSDALAGGDRIWAVIRGSAVNQDGAGAGMTVPNGLAQQAVIRKAMTEARVEPSQIGYIEAHGTGTKLGDPLELRSLWSVLKAGRRPDASLIVGSLKTNVGHMEGAAGIGSLIKTVLALRHGSIPPHLHVRQLNPLIAEEGIPLIVPRQLTAWPENVGGRVAGVSSFGMSGTNAHMILAAGPEDEAVADGAGGQDARPPKAHALCLSARTEAQLRELAGRYRDLLQAGVQEPFADVCFTANTGRTHWQHRLAVLAGNEQDCAHSLSAWLEGKPHVGIYQGSASDSPVHAAKGTDQEQLARRYADGDQIDWRPLYEGQRLRKVSLPTYPFNRQRYWADLPTGTPLNEDAGLQALSGLYEVKWHHRELPPSAATRPVAHALLLLSEQSAPGRELAHLLEGQGGACTLHTSPPTEFEAVLRKALARAGGRPLDVVYLWGLDIGETLNSETLHHAEQVVWPGLLHLAKALARTAAGQPARLWVVTRGVHQAVPEDTQLRPAGSVLWGLGQAFGLEHANLWGGMIDLPAKPSPEDARHIASELRASDGEERSAYRSGRRLVARLERLAAPPLAAEASFDAYGGCWITGGLGAIGLQTAEWLVQRGARCLVLQGRTGLPDRTTWSALSEGDGDAYRRVRGVRKLESLGAQVELLAADVADPAFVAQARGLLARLDRPLQAIFHAAGVSGLCSLTEMTVEGLQAVLAPKVRGLCNLHQLAADFPSTNIVSFSSIASVWGSRSLGHYAAANYFLDSFTHDRRARGLPAVSINWGPLQGGGMGLAREEERLSQLGIRAVSRARFGAVLSRLLGSDVRQVTVADVDWAVFRPLYEAQRRRPFLELISPSVHSADRPAQTAERDRLLSAGGEERLRLAEAFLLKQTAAVLKAPESQLDAAQPLVALGVDSLMAMEIAKRVQVQLSVTVPVSEFLQGSTLRGLAQVVDAGLGDAPAPVSVEGNGHIVEGEL